MISVPFSSHGVISSNYEITKVGSVENVVCFGKLYDTGVHLPPRAPLPFGVLASFREDRGHTCTVEEGVRPATTCGISETTECQTSLSGFLDLFPRSSPFCKN
ncbi:hypothetical protein WA026_010478 [Henosepilachna vigintioctopunctata]|uniref:Uncharacterized protein n=1 Tax=Henosepilachna vigintioctopunctata TaxID=420089 RepID=A0AAW1VDE9_9CUCU